jgi:hypothetical protein
MAATMRFFVHAERCRMKSTTLFNAYAVVNFYEILCLLIALQISFNCLQQHYFKNTSPFKGEVFLKYVHALEILLFKHKKIVCPLST